MYRFLKFSNRLKSPLSFLWQLLNKSSEKNTDSTTNLIFINLKKFTQQLKNIILYNACEPRLEVKKALVTIESS